MASVSTYLNFPGNTEEAFLFYRSVFGTEFLAPGIRRMEDGPQPPGQPLSGQARRQVLHVALPLIGGHELMGTDCVPDMGPPFVVGTNVSILLRPDSRAETGRLFAGLSEGGRVEMPLQEMFWGDYFGTLVDCFGVQWMFNCDSKA